MSPDKQSEHGRAEYQARRVYLLYPDRVLREEVAPALIRKQYETYLIDDHRAFSQVFHPENAIVYANVDAALDDYGWKQFLAGLEHKSPTDSLQLGILSHDNQKVESWKQSDLSLGAGCLPIQTNITGPLMVKLLDRLGARGRRKYVRARCGRGMSVTFNVHTPGGLRSGHVNEISVAGMTCEFDGSVSLEPNTYLRNMLITARDIRCSVSGTVIGTAADRQDVFVVVFDKDVSSTDEEKLHDITHACLQASMERTLKAATG